jgi:GMP synthase-like glutamine amidotransferase
LGGTISTSPQPEIGWQPIEYADTPEVEEWFSTNPTPRVIQWHYETFSIPAGATRLAGSTACANQAWAMGSHLAMQFHIEMDEIKAREWAMDEDPKWAAARAQYVTVQDRDGILNGIQPHLTQHQATADHIYQTWLKTTDWAGVL